MTKSSFEENEADTVSLENYILINHENVDESEV